MISSTLLSSPSSLAAAASSLSSSNNDDFPVVLTTIHVLSAQEEEKQTQSNQNDSNHALLNQIHIHLPSSNVTNRIDHSVPTLNGNNYNTNTNQSITHASIDQTNKLSNSQSTSSDTASTSTLTKHLLFCNISSLLLNIALFIVLTISASNSRSIVIATSAVVYLFAIIAQVVVYWIEKKSEKKKHGNVNEMQPNRNHTLKQPQQQQQSHALLTQQQHSPSTSSAFNSSFNSASSSSSPTSTPSTSSTSLTHSSSSSIVSSSSSSDPPSSSSSFSSSSFSSTSSSSSSSSSKYPVGCYPQLQCIAVIIVCCFMAMSALIFIYLSAQQLNDGYNNNNRPNTDIDPMAITILAITIATKLVMWIYCSLYSKYSPTIMTIAVDHRNDLLSGVIALIAAILSWRWSSSWCADPIGAIIMSIYIGWNWGCVGREQVEMIIGKAADSSFIEEIRSLSTTLHRSLTPDFIRAYHFGNRFLVELELILPDEMSMREAQEIAGALQRSVERMKQVERCVVCIRNSNTAAKVQNYN